MLLLAAALLAPEWPGARLAITAGAVEIGRGEPPVWKPAENGDALGAGDLVRTGADGRAEVQVAGATVRLYPNSLLRLPESAPQGGGEAVELREGTSLFDVRKRKDSPFEVRTPEVVVSVKGTRFGVALGDGDASVSVFRGLVGVRGGAAAAAAAETLVHPGFMAHGSDRFELSWHGADDPWEDWNDGDLDPTSLRGEWHEAALQDARFAALAQAGELNLPANQEDSEADPRVDTDELQGSGKALGQLRDPIADASKDVRNTLGGEMAEDLVNQAGGRNGDLLEVIFDSGSGRSGGDQWIVNDLTSGASYVLDEDLLEDVKDGEASLPTGLTDLLDQAGIQPDAFTNQLLAGNDDD
jgi:hypothetical protein